MACTKAEWKNPNNAKKVAEKINDENKFFKINVRLRVYKCKTCKKFHLTSDGKHSYKLSDPVYCQRLYDKQFIQLEAAYWNRYFKIETE